MAGTRVGCHGYVFLTRKDASQSWIRTMGADLNGETLWVDPLNGPRLQPEYLIARLQLTNF